MKVFFSLAALALAQTCNAVAQQSTTDLKSDFLRWKASEAGQHAYSNGFVPTRSSTSKISLMGADDEPTQDELARFQNSIDTVARLQEQQPHATFSIDTPFALMTSSEFQAYVEKSGVQEHMKEVEKHISSQSLPADVVAAVNASSAAESAATTTTFTTTNNVTRKLDTWVVNIDWQTKGCVTRVKSQGSCGVCWAFSATGALESGYCAKTGKLYELSEQEAVSCSRTSPSCYGNAGGYTFDWVNRLNGGTVCTEATYPYASGSGTAPNCRRFEGPSFTCERPNLGAYFYGGGDFAAHTQLEAAVLKQPVASSIAAVGSAFQYYKSGVLMGDEQNCSAEKTNHEVLVVGYGTLNGIPYWKIKNQWSTSWGDNGWMYIERGYQGHTYGACGVEKYGFYPIFPSTSDPGLSKRITTPREGYYYTGTLLKVLFGIYNAIQCGARCTQEPTCVAFNFYGTVLWCELKSTNTGIVASDDTTSGTVITKAASLAKCSPIASNVDFPANDYQTTIAASAEDCCDHCDAVRSCNAFTWSKYNGGTCYLKRYAPATPVAAAADSDGTPYLRSGLNYKCQPLVANTDRPGFDLTSVASSTAANCCGICRWKSLCAAFTWTDYNGGTCWLKTAGSSTAASTGAISGSVF